MTAIATTTVAVVCNPAKVEDASAFRALVESLANGLGHHPVLWFETTEDDPGEGMARAALDEGADLVVVAGGDGTVAAVAGALAGSPAAMAIIPAGTGNLLARNLDLPLDVAGALEIAFGAGRRTIDVLESDGKRFVVMAGVGFDAILIEATAEGLKGRVGWPAYLGGAARALRRSRPVPMTIEIDGRPELQCRALGVLVGNVGNLEGGMTLLPDAAPDDGLLDVVVLHPRGLRGWLSLLNQGLRGGPPRGRALHTDILRGHTVRIRSAVPLPSEFDGDLHAGDPRREFEVSVLPGALTLCVPFAAEEHC